MPLLDDLAEKRPFAYSCQAIRPNGANSDVCHFAFYTTADNPDDAVNTAKVHALRGLPPEIGWMNHNISVVDIKNNLVYAENINTGTTGWQDITQPPPPMPSHTD